MILAGQVEQSPRRGRRGPVVGEDHPHEVHQGLIDAERAAAR
ncbi:MAG: hypothetical protein OSA99_05120 [Acidimicrobiales bacterium]|nr:hypothetical protein [Acidimicrobiales bacterium]